MTRDRLASRGIRTIGQLAEVDEAMLEPLLGRAAGQKLGALAANRDPRAVATGRRARSVGAQSALGRRPATTDTLREALGYLADRVAARLRRAGCAGRAVTVRVRFADMRSVTRSVTTRWPTAATLTLAELATGLAAGALDDHPDEDVLTLVGLSVSHLVHDVTRQLELPVDLDDPHRIDADGEVARWAADRAIDAIRERFGRDAVGYAAVALSGDRHVPEGFRQLAERDP